MLEKMKSFAHICPHDLSTLFALTNIDTSFFAYMAFSAANRRIDMFPFGNEYLKGEEDG